MAMEITPYFLITAIAFSFLIGFIMPLSAPLPSAKWAVPTTTLPNDLAPALRAFIAHSAPSRFISGQPMQPSPLISQFSYSGQNLLQRQVPTQYLHRQVLCSGFGDSIS